jgi:hypothetical protein
MGANGGPMEGQSRAATYTTRRTIEQLINIVTGQGFLSRNLKIQVATTINES